MYSSPQFEEQLVNHATVGAMPVHRNQVFAPYVRQNAAYPFENQAWFGTSLDSTGSSFGQSPPFVSRDIVVSPSTSTPLDDDKSQQKK
jgi:hypothetical protein